MATEGTTLAVASTSLDPRNYPSSDTTEERDDVAWRFRRHIDERNQLAAALKRQSDPRWFRRAKRFALCGAYATVWHSASTGQAMVQAMHCGLRTCPRCRATYTAKAHERITRFALAVEPGKLSLITLTLRSSNAPLGVQLDNLIEAFRRLRTSSLWRQANPRGYGSIEVTYSPDRHQWHPHIHLLAETPYLPHAKLSAAWLKASRGSMIVDVRRIRGRDTATAVNYVASYVAKAPKEAVRTSPDLLDEWLVETCHRRFSIRFGRPALRPAEPKPPGPSDWRLVGTLAAIARAAAHGNAQAVYWLKLVCLPGVQEAADQQAWETYHQTVQEVNHDHGDYAFYDY